MKPLHSIFELHQKLTQNQVIIAYEGELNSQITNSVLSLAEKNMETRQVDFISKRKAFTIAVECLQNISAHAEKDLSFSKSIFMIGRSGGDYFVTAGNVIKADKVEKLQRKIEQINNLDGEGLKRLHMQAIKESMQKQDVSNPGLGLISIARKTGRKIDFEFVEMEDGVSFFSFQASFQGS